jgi:hypothetical protein
MDDKWNGVAELLLYCPRTGRSARLKNRLKFDPAWQAQLFAKTERPPPNTVWNYYFYTEGENENTDLKIDVVSFAQLLKDAEAADTGTVNWCVVLKPIGGDAMYKVWSKHEVQPRYGSEDVARGFYLRLNAPPGLEWHYVKESEVDVDKLPLRVIKE